jgi:hypothetical protein
VPARELLARNSSACVCAPASRRSFQLCTEPRLGLARRHRRGSPYAYRHAEQLARSIADQWQQVLGPRRRSWDANRRRAESSKAPAHRVLRASGERAASIHRAGGAEECASWGRQPKLAVCSTVERRSQSTALESGILLLVWPGTVQALSFSIFAPSCFCSEIAEWRFSFGHAPAHGGSGWYAWNDRIRA